MRGIKRTTWITVVPVLLLLAVTLPHLEQGDFRAETSHYGAIGLQAWRTPALFWTLHEHPAVPYFNKPPLVFWIHGLFLHCFGISLTAARLPSILAAAGCILFTVGIARRWFGRATALTAGVILALSYEYFRRTREISLDLWQLFFMLATTWLWLKAQRSRSPGFIVAAGLSLGLALLCKPLLALMIPVIFLIWIWSDPSCRTATPKAMTLLLAAALLLALPWHLAMVHLYGDAFTRQYFGREVVARLQGLRNREPTWYYAVEMGRTYWPWMIFLLLGLIRWWKGPVSRHHRNALRWALAWVVVWMAAITLFPDKRPRYELPLYPMLAILSAYGVVTLPWGGLRQWYRNKLPVTTLLILATGLVAGLIPLRIQAPPDPDLSALVGWVGDHNPDTLYSVAMTSSDESMIYLKTGRWPNPPRVRPHPVTGSLLVYTDGMEPAPEPDATCVFKQGPYRVMRK